MTEPSEFELDVAAQLRASEERYHFLAENIPVQIWTSLPNGQLDYVSRQTARALGLTPEQLLEHGWKEVVHPEDLAKAVERWTRSLASGLVYEVEFRLKLASGTYAWHLARAIPQRNAAGAIVRWFGTNTNVEEQREQLRQREAMFDEISRQLTESAAALLALQQRHAAATQRLSQLEKSAAVEQNDAVHEWEALARMRLVKLLGDEAGKQAMLAAMTEAGLSRISSAEELRLFGEALKPRGGLLGATGSQLVLHAVIHNKAG